MAETLLLRDLPRFECLERRAQRYEDLDASAVVATLSLLRVASDVLEAMGAHFERNNVSQARFLVLMLLDRERDESASTSTRSGKKRESVSLLPSEIADKMGVTRANITGLLDGLERDGLTARHPHPEDRRALCVTLTREGSAFLEAMLPDHYRRVAGLMTHLSPREQEQLVRLLSKVAQGTNALRDQEWTNETK